MRTVHGCHSIAFFYLFKGAVLTWKSLTFSRKAKAQKYNFSKIPQIP